MIITRKLKQTQQNASKTDGELKGHPSVRIFMWFREYTVKTDVKLNVNKNGMEPV
jgi:hypothetical protein